MFLMHLIEFMIYCETNPTVWRGDVTFSNQCCIVHLFPNNKGFKVFQTYKLIRVKGSYQKASSPGHQE